MSEALNAVLLLLRTSLLSYSYHLAQQFDAAGDALYWLLPQIEALTPSGFAGSYCLPAGHCCPVGEHSRIFSSVPGTGC